ncbi:hypothetical protein SAMN05892883_3568 [Jatrophihabitans sp. GAS493]|uniref:hypothetical protein n=1 Tax=Jatrophihabitans sp. GAS493 TaxID=1907575 RepID=UPI000BC02369|nr:hypothetical protein [Jatrophihabitans sp. GAS493]SOD74384.1 hypothetical protein SAMN05892883_3568 [Jatrophihabitans sp. GAS493]
MLIDCRTCSIRDTGCADCVITVLLASPPLARSELDTSPLDSGDQVAVVELDLQERSALAALADGGLVPPLRLSPSVGSGSAAAAPISNETRQGLNAKASRRSRAG